MRLETNASTGLHSPFSTLATTNRSKMQKVIRTRSSLPQKSPTNGLKCPITTGTSTANLQWVFCPPPPLPPSRGHRTGITYRIGIPYRTAPYQHRTAQGLSPCQSKANASLQCCTAGDAHLPRGAASAFGKLGAQHEPLRPPGPGREESRALETFEDGTMPNHYSPACEAKPVV